MPIQTIDHYLVAPRSQEASQVRQQDTARVPQEQGFLQVQSDRQGKQQAERTSQLKETENKEERYDAKEKGKNSYEGQKRQRKKQNDEEPKKHTREGGSLFDIKI
ncbi:MAG: hypothetical protein HFI40_14955 [Lachnospiraceae bacterium]|jgi:hypothetical protein|nr:hypothetical protein [Lachnospiraceae bacterium]